VAVVVVAEDLLYRVVNDGHLQMATVVNEEDHANGVEIGGTGRQYTGANPLTLAIGNEPETTTVGDDGASWTCRCRHR
jgi:hypothetical protein